MAALPCSNLREDGDEVQPVICRSEKCHPALARARLPKGRLGQTIAREDGHEFTIFRQVVIQPTPHQSREPRDVFEVWFYGRTTHQQTILMSRLTILFFLGLPGFRSKLWLLDDSTGEFGGVYEWDTVQDADSYDKSFAMKLSQRRSVPGKFYTKVYPRLGS